MSILYRPVGCAWGKGREEQRWLREEGQQQGPRGEMGEKRESGGQHGELGIAHTLPPHGSGSAGKGVIPISVSLIFCRAKPTLQLLPNPVI